MSKRYTSKSLEADVATLNEKLTRMRRAGNSGVSAAYMQVGGRNGYTAVDWYVERDGRMVCQCSLVQGTPRECLSAAQSFVLAFI